MAPPLTKVLLKMFARCFYRVHAGLLLSLFVTILIYFLFINVLNLTHIPPEQRILYHLSLVLAFVSNPLVMGLVGIAWLAYTVKSCQYVAAQLRATEHQFLFYSSTAMSRSGQLRSWLVVQAVISAPMIGFGLFAMMVGVHFDHYLIPALIPLYLLALLVGSARWYAGLANGFVDGAAEAAPMNLVRSWPKPLFSLFLYQVAYRLKLSYAVTKLLSWVILCYLYGLFSELEGDIRVAGFVILTVVTSHALLIYQSHQFEKNYLPFTRNFPYRRLQWFLHFIGLYGLLLLPETIWLLVEFPPMVGLTLLLFAVSTSLLYRSLLYGIVQATGHYLPVVFGLFVGSFLAVMGGLLWLLVPVNGLVAFAVFYRNYYRSAD